MPRQPRACREGIIDNVIESAKQPHAVIVLVSRGDIGRLLLYEVLKRDATAERIRNEELRWPNGARARLVIPDRADESLRGLHDAKIIRGCR